MPQPKLQYFKRAEFREWWDLMNPDLLVKLDLFREILGSPVIISPAKGALGRPGARKSQHYPNPDVRAVDVMIESAVPMEIAYQVALDVEFTGIGLYPDWKPKHGLHLDVRLGREPGNPALWSAYRDSSGVQRYADVARALS